MTDIGPGDLVVCKHLRPRGTDFDASLARLKVGGVYNVRLVHSDNALLLRSPLSDHPLGSQIRSNGHAALAKARGEA